MMNPTILAIETSCDETAAAVVRDYNESGRTWVLSSIVASQNDIHGQFGGIIPELASRRHVEVLPAVVREAMTSAGLEFKDLDGIAVTSSPGLVGALLVGVSYAKALSFSTGLPLIGVNHLAGHLASVMLEGKKLPWPHLGLIVSGGHTLLFYGGWDDQGARTYALVGSTRDDAAGEAFDKVAKLMGMGYPGGALIEKAALAYQTESKKTDAPSLKLPKVKFKDESIGFSFSGLKTAVAQHISKMPDYNPNELAYLFQERVAEMLVAPLELAVSRYRPKAVIFCGGVAANKRLRQGIEEFCKRQGIGFEVPPIKWCTDNAAMIGAAGLLKLRNQQFSDLELKAKPNMLHDADYLRQEFFPIEASS